MSRFEDKNVWELLHALGTLKEKLSKLNCEILCYEDAIKHKLIEMVVDQDEDFTDAWHCLKVDPVRLKKFFTLEE
tara:strand:+ start:566 stop:790 length:225 start_codon:yes stop_codon:yes gene_type:complete